MARPANTADRAADSVTPALRAGIAIYNGGRYHAAHDAWEHCWLDQAGDDDERLLHGLIQFTAAVHHATQENRDGATGLAESAREYLTLPENYRDVNVGDLRAFLARFGADPRVEHTPPIEMTYRERALTIADLGFDASAVVARAFAEADGFDVERLDRAIAYARDDLDSGEATSPFVTLVYDLAREDNRGIIYQRLAEHTQRRRARDESVDDLFEQR